MKEINASKWTVEQWNYYYEQYLKEYGIEDWNTHRDAVYRLDEPPIWDWIIQEVKDE